MKPAQRRRIDDLLAQDLVGGAAIHLLRALREDLLELLARPGDSRRQAKIYKDLEVLDKVLLYEDET